MQTTKRCLTVARWGTAGLGLVIVAALGSAECAAHGQSAGAVVVGILGEVSASFPGQGTMPIRSGMNLPAGATVITGPRAAVDLNLGGVAGVVRLAENSTLKLEKLNALEPALDPASTIGLRLLGGTLLGNSHKVPAGASFEVKVANGIVGIDRGQYRIHGRGFVVLIEGRVVVAHVPAPGQQPESHVLDAPPAVYFSPLEKVRLAPPVLIKEVLSQTKSKLPRK